MKRKKMPPVHPGIYLLEEFLEPLGLSQNRLAISIGVPARRINEIVLGRRSISADTAVRLSAFFGTTPEFWMNLQSHYDLELVKDSADKELLSDIKRRARRLVKTTD
ncbi:MAG: HigA family addiction module antitoxin [Nitrospinota bacterium]